MRAENQKCLNALRGLGACVIAFVWHYQHFAPQDGTPFYSLCPLFYRYGYLFVQLFFMLSGFGMVLGYETLILKSEISFAEYISRRLKRLLPLLWITLGAVTALQFIYKAKTGTTFVYSNFDFYHFILNVIGIQYGILGTNFSFNGPAWCISGCIFCYILLYIVVKKGRESAQELSWIYLGIAILGAAVAASKVSLPILNGTIATAVSCFFIGGFLAKASSCNHKKFLGYVSVLGLILSWIFIGFLEMGVGEGNIGLITVFWFAPLLILSVLYVPWLRRLCEWKVLNDLGSISFEIYLWHFPVQCLIKILDLYFGLNINYSTKQIWILYAASVVLVSALYKQYVSPKLAKKMK